MKFTPWLGYLGTTFVLMVYGNCRNNFGLNFNASTIYVRVCATIIINVIVLFLFEI